MTSRQDKTRSPGPNRLAQLYAAESNLEQEIRTHQVYLADAHLELRRVRAAIKRANGDSGAKI